MTITDFFEHLWQDYVQMTPQANAIANALIDQGETVLNDHVAFRTFNIGHLRLENLEPLILELGYTRFEPYHFSAKKLDAVGYLPPQDNLPRIFISELRVEELSTQSQTIIHDLVDSVTKSDIQDASIFWRGLLWNMPSFEQYKVLAAESEYAAWLSVIGLRANHFTIDVNALKSFSDVSDINDFIEHLGFVINDSGGKVKGSPAVMLEQSSTMASTQTLTFANGDEHSVPTCYYEFAKRYQDKNGNIYQGFVAASADKIFESTNVTKHS